MLKKAFFYLILPAVLLSLSACFYVNVSRTDRFPAEAFTQAQQAIARIAAADPQRRGHVRKLHVMVYEGDDGELVRASFPIWLVKLGMKWDAKDEEARDHRDTLAKAADTAGVDWDDPDTLIRLGPGLIAQVDEVEDDTHVLVWLE